MEIKNLIRNLRSLKFQQLTQDTRTYFGRLKKSVGSCTDFTVVEMQITLYLFNALTEILRTKVQKN